MTTHLTIATLPQLVKWQADINAEIARRASAPAEPQEARAPWEVESPRDAYVAAVSQMRNPSQTAQRALDAEELHRIRAMNASPQEQIDARIAELMRERATLLVEEQQTGLARPTAPPSMLGGKLPPGAVLPNPKTDPALQARFNQIPLRMNPQAPPIHGNGIGEGGAAEMEPG